MAERNKIAVMRLNEWADWVHSGIRSGPAMMRSWWGPMVTDPNMGANDGYGRRSKEPVNDVRAGYTDEAVKALEFMPKLYIWQHYIKGGTKEQKAWACGCSAAQFYRNLADAEQLVANYFEGSGKKMENHLTV